MEKVVLSKGYEFPIVTNAVRTGSNYVEITFIPGEYSVEQLMTMWEGNSQILIKIDDTAIQSFNNYMRCAQMTLVKDYLIETKFTCPACGVEVEPNATTCYSCNAGFEAPNMEEVRADVCTVKVMYLDINDRMADAEDAIEDIINTILG